jgi:serine phosphatase RsbU (regulator of sigma subunit)/predicted transcriptional regulator
MDEPRTIIPLVRDIMVTQREIPPSMKVCEVVEVFRADPSLRVLPLVEDGRCVGSVSRKNLFFRHLSRKFASDLFSNKPIAVLKDENPVLMEPQLDSTNALARLLEIDPLLEIDSFLIVDGERCLGVVPVSDLMMRISETQQSLLVALRSMSDRIREEVAHASRIQQELLPDPAFRFNGITIAAGITTSTEIGGDFYDYFPCGDNRLGLIIADVSGHGVQSGMVTTAAKASLHTLLSSGVSTPAELLTGMNRAIIATARRRLLMTCFIAVIDTVKERLDYANAGHNFPYRYRGHDGELELLEEASGFPLGFEDGAGFREYTMEFGRGDSLVLYTDGIVECRGGDDEEFGYERMERMIRTSMGSEPDVLVHALLEGAREFAGTYTLEDDATVLVASFAP